MSNVRPLSNYHEHKSALDLHGMEEDRVQCKIEEHQSESQAAAPPPPLPSLLSPCYPHFATATIISMFLGAEEVEYSCIDVIVDPEKGRNRTMGMTEIKAPSSCSSSSDAVSSLLALGSKNTRNPTPPQSLDRSTASLHAVSFSGTMFPLPPAPLPLPVRDSDTNHAYVFVPYNRESGFELTLCLRGFWEGWDSRVQLRGTLSITTQFYDPLWNKYPLRNLENEAHWHKVFQPTIELISEQQPNLVFINELKDTSVFAPFDATLGFLTMPFKVRISKNLIASNIDVRRRKEQGPTITFFFTFNPDIDCLKSHLQLSMQKAQNGYLPPHLLNAELERYDKLRRAKNVGRVTVTMYAKK